MKTGISVYPGVDGTAEEHLALVAQAAELGICRLFTSLHIPETNRRALKQEWDQLLSLARRLHMDVIADISPKTADLLHLDAVTPQALLRRGITTARLDEGFTVRQTALFSRMMQVQLNASTLRPAYIKHLRREGADFSHIDCLHNFYPRPNTGLAESYVAGQNDWLRQEKLHVGAFIPSQTGRRGPLYEGLPTLEAHRRFPVSLAARHLAALGIQSVFIGDSAPSAQELADLSRAGREGKNIVVLKARLLSRDPFIRDFLSSPFTARPDMARDAVRASESRAALAGRILAPDGPCRMRQRGDITVDNALFLRYMGEVQLITAAALPAEKRTNIAASIVPEERFLLSYITPGRKFRLEFIR